MGKDFNVTLNIRYDQPKEYWIRLEEIYSNMDGWKGYIRGIPYWYGNDSTGHIYASVEPSGLQLYGSVEESIWINWVEEFKERCSEALGYKIGEPEKGFEFPVF